MDIYEFDYRRGEISAMILANSEEEAYRKLKKQDFLQVVVNHDYLRQEFWKCVDHGTDPNWIREETNEDRSKNK